MGATTFHNGVRVGANEADDRLWKNLERAIALSSGFQRWQLERYGDGTDGEWCQADRIRRYLRETLETLAY